MLWAVFVCIGAVQFAGGHEKDADQADDPQGLNEAAAALDLP